jgi:uncharacterized protein (DUF952 family)
LHTIPRIARKPDPPPAHDIFISYSSKDEAVAETVYAGLDSRGLPCWMARQIVPGSDWGAAIVEAIESSKVFVHANRSEQVKREVASAVAKGVKIVSFRIEDAPMSKNLEYFLSTPHWLDATAEPLEPHVAHLAETIRFLMATRDSRQVPPPLRRAAAHEPLPPVPTHPAVRWPAAAAAVAAFLVALAVAYLVAGRKAPRIIAINFPATISAGSREVAGTLQFEAGGGEVRQAEFSVVDAQSFEPFTVTPRVAGQSQGSLPFALKSKVPQQVTLQATLVDADGRRSRPVSFTFEVRKSAAGSRGIEIVLPPPPFKFKIPR